MKTTLALLLAIILLQSCKTQQLQTKTSVPKLENQLKGELDYTTGGFELVQWQSNGNEIILGSIDETGEIHFVLPEYDIKALGKTHMNANLESQFNMLKCNGKGEFDMLGQPLFKTPYDDVYSQMYPPIYVKKYGVSVAYISPVSNEKMLIKENRNKITGNRYYWMYIDRALEYKDTCIQTSPENADLEIERTADIQFKKGWNFIEAKLAEIQSYGENDENTIPKTIQFTLSPPVSTEVKWYLEQLMNYEEIQAAKTKFELLRKQ